MKVRRIIGTSCGRSTAGGVRGLGRLFALLGGWTAAGAAAQTTTPISTSWNGSAVTGDSDIMSAASVSATGQYIAFASDAANLVPGDANGARDVFVFDRFNGTRVIVSIDSNRTQGDADSSQPVGPGGYGVAISRSGRLVTFNSWATNLVANDTNLQPDIFVHDRDFDGNLVFDQTFAGAVRTVRVNVDSNGNQTSGTAQTGSSSSLPVISADGRHVAFVSTATNLVANDTNGLFDVFVHDRDADCNGVFDETFTGARRTTRISISSAGVESNGSVTSGPSISADGRFIVFDSDATNLVTGGDNNNAFDVFLYDRDADNDGRLDETGPGETALIRVSVSSSGAEANGASAAAYGGALSADGRYVLFNGAASNLVPNDTNNAGDVFVRDQATGITTRVSVSSSGAESTAGGGAGVISPDGQFVAFQSCGQDLAPLPPFSPNAMRMYLHDRDADGNGVFDETFAGAVATTLVDVVNGCPPIVTFWQGPRAALADSARCAMWSSPPSGGIPATVLARGLLPDQDGDGLLDVWETNGIDADGDGNVDLTLPNANVSHKDLYVEVDAMNGRAPAVATMNAVITSFANAPVPNPDGQTGITLHVQLDETAVTPTVAWTWPPPQPPTCPNGPGFPPEFCTFKTARFGTPTERGSMNAANILAAKALTYHYAVFANQLGNTTISGVAELPGNDVIVTLGGWTPAAGTAAQQQGLFMHELGHNLGLHHGGAITDGINGKANYHSVMNYTWTVPALVPTQNPTPYTQSWILDYSSAAWHCLDELSLNEPLGIGGHQSHLVPTGPMFNVYSLQSGTVQTVALLVAENGAVDWNRNGFTTDLAATNNINQLPNVNPNSPAGEYLRGHDDWSNLWLPLRGHPNFANGVSGYVTGGDELTYEMVQALARIGDCNGNGVWDQQEIDSGAAQDADGDGLPDECAVPCGFVLNDDFEGYAPGSQLHGQGGWRGWDNNEAASAPISIAHAHSPLRSVEIAGAADLVHAYCSRHSTSGSLGMSSVSVWQYIPAGFSSNGGGPFAGTYFVVLNNYSDGGPHNPPDWSVQVQFDSNDGLMKVFHGDGINTINVPYVSNRWVKLQSIIDLDADWTRIYYDDTLVAEYPWTGGVLGGGGGELDIQAIDLYANGSSPVYYDDVRIQPGCGVSPLSDADGDGLNLLNEFLLGTDPCIPDTDGDGLPDGVDPCPNDPENDLDFDGVCGNRDNCPLAPNPLQEDADGDGFGDACDAPGDSDHDGAVSLDDYSLFASCLSGPNMLPNPAPPATGTQCQVNFDFNADADVDLLDFATLQRGFTGP